MKSTGWFTPADVCRLCTFPGAEKLPKSTLLYLTKKLGLMPLRVGSNERRYSENDVKKIQAYLNSRQHE